MTNLLTLLFCNTPLQPPWQPSTCGLRRHQGWLISKLIPQNYDTEVLSLKREKLKPQMEGSLHITVRNVTALAAYCAVMPHSSLYWLGTQTGSYRCCPASQRAATFSIALTEEQEICRKSRGPQRVVEVGPGCRAGHSRGNPSISTSTCTLKKDVSKWFLFSTMWDNNTDVSMWVVIGLLCWKRMCGTWLILFCECHSYHLLWNQSQYFHNGSCLDWGFTVE